jgi:hypothetical protein
MTRRLDVWTVAGIGVAATTAAIASAGAQHQLAVAAGWGNATAWLLPGCVDTLAAVGARVWLDATATDSARRYARTVALVAVAVSLTLNAAGHATAVGLLSVSVPLVVAVGAVPAVSLAATVHLSAVRTAPVASRRQRRRGPQEAALPATRSATPSATQNPRAATTPPPASRSSRSMTTRSDSATSSAVTPIIPGDTATDRARHHWDHERARGRTPSGAELARVAQCSPSMGRKLAGTFRDTDTDTDTETAATATTAGSSQ